MKKALHRAAIFLGYSANIAAQAPLASIKLQSVINLEVGVPDPLEAEQLLYYQSEYIRWSIGQGLSELDQCYQRFVVSAINTVVNLDYFVKTKEFPESRKPNLENSWNVHEQFFKLSGQRSEFHLTESGFLRSLGNARNCLAHSSGVVSERLLNESGRLIVRWPGRDMFMTRPSADPMLLPRDRGHVVAAEDVGAEFSVVPVTREQSYQVNDIIQFSATDLSEIIYFYQHLAMQVGAEIHRRVYEAIDAETIA